MAGTNTLTPYFRVSYPNVFRAKKNDLNGKDEFSLVAIFPKGEDLSRLKKAAQEVIEAKWGTDKKKWPKNLRSPFRLHDEKAVENDDGSKVYPMGMEEGGIFINMKSSQRPGLVNGKNEDIIDESEFYAGCYARATVRPYTYDNKGNTGVAFGLQNVQKWKDGDPLGSRTKAQDDFAPIEGADDAAGSDSSNIFG